MNTKLYYILGLGQTGLSVVRYLQKRHQSFEVFDDKLSSTGLKAFQAEFPSIPVHLQESYQAITVEAMAKVHEVIISPGVPLDHPIVIKARAQNIPVIGDIELFTRENKAPVVAITGTNGKSTVTTLVGEMAKAAGLKTFVGGNLGEPALNHVDESFDWCILELSSFQLESTYTLAPRVACILNITPDHMDRYATFEDYVTAKHRIYERATYRVMCLDDPLTEPNSFSQKNTISFGLSAPADNETWGIITKEGHTYLSYGSECLMDVNDLKIKGTHNWSNALAALALGKCMGLSIEGMCEVLRQFPGLLHRCQWVRELDHVQWYNDSKGTNVGATLSAIRGLGDAIQGKVVLLLGGQTKDADFAELCAPLKKYVRSVILYGQDAERIHTMLKDTVPLLWVNSFEEVINTARKEAQAGDVVLLSPACASWDMFDNFNHRGQVFTDLVLQL